MHNCYYNHSQYYLPLFVEEHNHLPLLSSPTNSIRGNKLVVVMMYDGAPVH